MVAATRRRRRVAQAGWHRGTIMCQCQSVTWTLRLRLACQWPSAANLELERGRAGHADSESLPVALHAGPCGHHARAGGWLYSGWVTVLPGILLVLVQTDTTSTSTCVKPLAAPGLPVSLSHRDW